MTQDWILSLQSALSPSVRSRGASLAREGKFFLESQSNEEWRIQVAVPGQVVNRTVQLWPEDEDAYCDCKDRDDPCVHIAACLVRAKAGQFDERDAQTTSSDTEGLVRYVFSEENGALALERRVRFQGQEHRIAQSLVSLVGALQSGRSVPFRVQASQADFGVELALQGHLRGPLKKERVAAILKALEASATLTFQDQPIRASGQPEKATLEISGTPLSGYRLSIHATTGTTRFFNNGIALINGVLRPSTEVPLSSEDLELLRSDAPLQGRTALHFFSEVLPRLQGRLHILAKDPLPECVDLSPSWSISANAVDTTRVLLAPRIVYGSPPLAEVTSEGTLHFLQTLSDPIPIRHPDAERKLFLQFRSRTGVHASSEIRLTPSAAQEWLERFENFRTEGDDTQSLLEPQTLHFQVEWPVNGDPILVSNLPLRGSSTDWVQQFQKGETILPLQSGGFARMPEDFMERFGGLFSEIYDKKRNPAQRNLSHQLLRAELAPSESGHDFSRLRSWIDSQTPLPPVSLPKDLTASLRAYQEEGVRWLHFLKTLELGGILADDMGLGKTLQTICILDSDSLVIAPTSVLHSWKDQIEKFRPGLNVQWYHGKDRKPFTPGSGVVLTSYALARLNPELFQNHAWSVLVLDEAQIVKNPESQTRTSLAKINARTRFLLSGTPVENRFLDLWSLFDLALPGALGDSKSFENRLHSSEGPRLRSRFRPFLLRRMKSAVAQELPPKTETVLTVELSSEERAVYDSLLTGFHPENLKTLELLEKILRLRQACNHLALLDPARSGTPSSKLSLLTSVVEDSLEQGHQILIFSQWTKLLDEVQQIFRKHLIPFDRLDGATRDRKRIVDDFQSGTSAPVLLMSLKAGGVGLNLTQADHVILLDPWWNPAAEQQATDRAHRIGQTRPVLIQRLIAEGTIEERVLALQDVKRAHLASVLEDTPAEMEMDRSDFLDLLRP